MTLPPPTFAANTAAADRNSGRADPFGLADRVEQRVDPVGAVDVGVARCAVQDGGARGDADVGVAGGLGEVIGLGLDDHARGALVLDDAPDEVGCAETKNRLPSVVMEPPSNSSIV